MKTVDIAKRIRQAREEAHLSQEELAQAVGVSDKSISAYEKSRSIPPVNKLKKIAESTHHPLNYFTDENIDEATIAAKLESIEKQLLEVKKLLQKST